MLRYATLSSGSMCMFVYWRTLKGELRSVELSDVLSLLLVTGQHQPLEGHAVQ